MSCLLGRTQHSNQPVKVLHRDTSGSKSREAVTTKVLHGLPCIPPAAPHCCRQQDPRRRLYSLTVAHVLSAAAAISPELKWGSEMAQPSLKQAASRLAVPALHRRQAGARATMVQKPGGKGLSTKWLPSIQLQEPMCVNKLGLCS